MSVIVTEILLGYWMSSWVVVLSFCCSRLLGYTSCVTSPANHSPAFLTRYRKHKNVNKNRRS